MGLENFDGRCLNCHEELDWWVYDNESTAHARCCGAEYTVTVRADEED